MCIRKHTKRHLTVDSCVYKKMQTSNISFFPLIFINSQHILHYSIQMITLVILSGILKDYTYFSSVSAFSCSNCCVLSSMFLSSDLIDSDAPFRLSFSCDNFNVSDCLSVNSLRIFSFSCAND